MAAKRTSARTSKSSAPPEGDVEAFLATLEHPFKPAILALRQILLGTDPTIAEGIKWNAPSFRTTEYFATFHLRAKEGVQIILHRGAKKRADAASGVAIADPESMLEWLGSDRATVKFRDLKEVDVRRAALAGLIRQWIKHV